jgi:hypothetical protein
MFTEHDRERTALGGDPVTLELREEQIFLFAVVDAVGEDGEELGELDDVGTIGQAVGARVFGEDLERVEHALDQSVFAH